jgi:hypothetical protein
MTEKDGFNIHVGDNPEFITHEQLRNYANLVGLNRVAKNRFSWLFVLNLYQYDREHGVDPTAVVDEIKWLENGKPGEGTKQATQFTHEPLRGFWHQHFFSAHFAAQNLLIQLSKGKLEAIAKQFFENKAVTKDRMGEFIHQVTSVQLEERYQAGKITGEWIVFAKHQGVHYYLCLATHTSGDQVIYDQIKKYCFPQFPFLQSNL